MKTTIISEVVTRRNGMVETKRYYSDGSILFKRMKDRSISFKDSKGPEIPIFKNPSSFKVVPCRSIPFYEQVIL